MSSVEISTGATEPIAITVLADGEPVIGAALTYQVSRVVGGAALEILDREDDTFRAPADVATRGAELAEVDVVEAPGYYRALLDTGAITNPSATGVYTIRIFDGADLLDSRELRMGTVDLLTEVADDVTALGTSVASVPAAVWALPFGTPSANTFGWALWRLAQWGTEINPKRINGQNLELLAAGGGSVLVTVPLKDLSGGLIAPAPGEPARFGL
jgi:hypothetical protein